LHLLGRIGWVVHQRDVANQHRDLAGAVEHDLGLCGLGVVVERDVVQLVLDLRHLEQRGAAEDGQQCEQDAEAGKQAGADGMVLHEADHGISPEEGRAVRAEPTTPRLSRFVSTVISARPRSTVVLPRGDTRHCDARSHPLAAPPRGRMTTKAASWDAASPLLQVVAWRGGQNSCQSWSAVAGRTLARRTGSTGAAARAAGVAGAGAGAGAANGWATRTIVAGCRCSSSAARRNAATAWTSWPDCCSRLRAAAEASSTSAAFCWVPSSICRIAWF